MFRTRLCRRFFACVGVFVSLTSAFADALPVLHIQGSNTIGAALGPALVAGLFSSQNMQVEVVPQATNEWSVLAHPASGPALEVEIDAHGTATGFAALQAGTADLAAASRAIHPSEQATLYGTVDAVSSGAEQVIGVDGVAIIVHPDNPLRSLEANQLADVFAGRVTQWEQLGVPLGAIHLLARDERSGTWETFRDLVLASRGLTLSATAARFEASDGLSQAVNDDPQAIGFIGLPYIRKARALAIADLGTRALLPTTETVATEDYLLSRRLYLYKAADTLNPWAGALVRFAQSDAGQQVVAREGFVSQQVHAVRVQPAAGMPEPLLALAREGQRLTVTFRFAGASAALDSKAMADIDRLATFLAARPEQRQRLVLVGFGDTKGEPERALLLSRLRAMTIRRELAKRGIAPRQVLGLGAALPVASNASEAGRSRNRRVEVWLQPAGL